MRARTLAVLLAAAASGCESIASEEPEIPGTYVLEAPVSYPSHTSQVTMLGDTFRLSAAGKAERRTRTRIVSADGRDTTAARISPYFYELKPGAIELTYACGPAELCAPPPHYRGRFEGGRMILDPASSMVPELRYRRAD